MDQISGNYFNRIKNVPIGFNLSFDSIDSIQFSGDNFWEVKTGPAKITFTGDNQHLLDSTVAPKFANVPISIRVYPPRGDGHFSLVFNFVSPEAPEYFGFEIQMNDAPLAADASANLQLSSFSSRASVILRRYVTPFAMSDFAYNSSIATLRFTAPNSVASEPPPSTSTSYENFRPYLARSGGLVKVSCGANPDYPHTTSLRSYRGAWNSETRTLPEIKYQEGQSDSLLITDQFEVQAGQYWMVQCQSYHKFSLEFTPR